ncbi:hypothetical protein Asp14428_48780 [Actinoplanes sp. NBRC 14428]|nr:hypothetical protein Asp14428_48780 [Actinoplanes sp. NBRC 14428]
MAARTMARYSRAETPHTSWCARDHRCGVNEHRSPDIEASDVGGRAWITRVRAGDREYAEIRARIPLHSNENVARGQLAIALDVMRELLAAVAAARPIRLSARAGRPAIDRRSA